jgi:hypothetical protein
MARMGWAGRMLGAVLITSLTLMGCATPGRVAAPTVTTRDPADPVEVARECDRLVKGLGYAKKSVAGRAAATAVLAPLAMGVGLLGVAMLDPRGLVLAVGGPIKLLEWTAQAGHENGERFQHLRQACIDGGGPDTVAAARAVRDLADVRRGERNIKDATRLYRDALSILDRAGAGESADAAATALVLASLVESKAPTDPEVGALYDRAVRIRQADAAARPRELATALDQYAWWLRTTGRLTEAWATQERVAALNRDIQAAVQIREAEAKRTETDALDREIQGDEERSRTLPIDSESTSTTDIVVAKACAQASVTALDQLNAQVAAEGSAARILAVDCDEGGQIRFVRLKASAGEYYVMFDGRETDTDFAERIRRALETSEP